MEDKTPCTVESRRRTVLKLGGLATTGLLAGCVGGDDDDTDDGEWPTQDIHHIIPYSQGGGTDTEGRQMLGAMQDILDVGIEIENIEGAGSLRGSQHSYNAPDDGYNFISQNPPVTQMGATIEETDWDPYAFEGVCHFGSVVSMLVANSDYGVEGLDDMIGRYQDGEFGNVGIQTFSHIWAAGTMVLESQEDFDMGTMIEYGGTGEIVEAVASDEVPVGWSTDTGGIDAVERGDVDVVAVVTPGGSAVFPDAEVYEDLGAVGAIARCFFASPGTPQEACNAYAEVAEEAFYSDDVQDWIEQSGAPMEWHGGPEHTNGILDETVEALEEHVDFDELREGM